MVITDKDYIIGFLKGTSADFKGRTYYEILECSDEELEKCHDQVQHIFPLHEHSNMAHTYPILSKEIVEESFKHCDGDVKLHVEYDNPAKRLYERIGFTNKYAEMRYKNK